MKMNPEIKKKWVEALRSGEYQQCTEKLWDGDNGFCCLGVLSDIRRKETGRGIGEFFSESLNSTDGQEVLSPGTSLWAGLKSDSSVSDPSNPRVFSGNISTCLSELNDRGTDFKYIADLIEEQL